MALQSAACSPKSTSPDTSLGGCLRPCCSQHPPPQQAQLFPPEPHQNPQKGGRTQFPSAQGPDTPPHILPPLTGPCTQGRQPQADFPPAGPSVSRKVVKTQSKAGHQVEREIEGTSPHHRCGVPRCSAKLLICPSQQRVAHNTPGPEIGGGGLSPSVLATGWPKAPASHPQSPPRLPWTRQTTRAYPPSYSPPDTPAAPMYLRSEAEAPRQAAAFPAQPQHGRSARTGSAEPSGGGASGGRRRSPPPHQQAHGSARSLRFPSAGREAEDGAAAPEQLHSSGARRRHASPRDGGTRRAQAQPGGRGQAARCRGRCRGNRCAKRAASKSLLDHRGAGRAMRRDSRRGTVAPFDWDRGETQRQAGMGGPPRPPERAAVPPPESARGAQGQQHRDQSQELPKTQAGVWQRPGAKCQRCRPAAHQEPGTFSALECGGGSARAHVGQGPHGESLPWATAVSGEEQGVCRPPAHRQRAVSPGHPRVGQQGGAGGNTLTRKVAAGRIQPWGERDLLPRP